MKFAQQVPPGYARIPRQSASYMRPTSLAQALAAMGVPIVCVPAKRPGPFGFYAPSWVSAVIGDLGTQSKPAPAPTWKLRLVTVAARLVPPADCAFVEEALIIRALSGDAGLLAWIDERA